MPNFAAQIAVYSEFFGFPMPDGETMRKVHNMVIPFGERKFIENGVALNDAEATPGRRLRVFSSMIVPNALGVFATWVEPEYDHQPLTDRREQTYKELLRSVEQFLPTHVMFEKLRLRNGLSSTTPATIDSIQPDKGSRNPELAFCLLDLGNEINEDIRDACEVWRNPDLYYPGIDEGIDPVSDDHIDLVIWALQRELDRELRTGIVSTVHLPAPPLMELPQRIKRALTERRRYRYAQFGIRREQWESGWWSLWDVPEDPDWVPRRQLRMAVAPAT
jgi:hypothetical protein